MPTTRATVRLNPESGLSADAAINVWHFNHTNALTEPLAEELALGLSNFYERIMSYYSATIDRDQLGHSVEFATLTPGAAGPEDDIVSKLLYTVEFPVAADFPAAPAVINLPTEVACAMSYRGDIDGINEEGPGNTRPASRRRGRIYLGPLNASVISGIVDARPLSAFRTAILDSYEALITELVALTEPWRHVVYSGAQGVTFGIVQVSVDDAFDTIRRRGLAPTFRTTRTVDWPLT